MAAESALAESIRTAVQSWPAPDHEQELLRADYVGFIESYPDAHLRSCRVGHVTASTLIVDPVHQSVLLTLHPTVGRWLQTGGHIEPDDAHLVAAAEREAREESGIGDLVLDATPLLLDRHELQCRAADGTYSALHHWDIQFMAIAPAGAQAICSSESLDLRWWPLTDLPGDDDSVSRLAHAAARRLAHR